jgi:hypothetical protein
MYSLDSSSAFGISDQQQDYHEPEYCLSQVHGGNRFHFGALRTWNLLNKHFPGHHIPFSFVKYFVAACPRCKKDRIGMTNNI